MIYRIHHDQSYLMHSVPLLKALEALGDEHGTFAISTKPKPYLKVWKPFEVDYSACTGSKAKVMPDISENGGRLCLSEKAFTVLEGLLSGDGEFLPVTSQAGQGCIFNPLKSAEELGAVKETSITFDQHGNLENFEFNEQALSATVVFKTALDNFTGIYCTQQVKDAIESEGLTGVRFYSDVSNPIGEPYGVIQ